MSLRPVYSETPFKERKRKKEEIFYFPAFLLGVNVHIKSTFFLFYCHQKVVMLSFLEWSYFSLSQKYIRMMN
jgi:hypothetical protein